MSIEQGKKFEAYTIAIRRQLHQIPEVAWEEEKTVALILREINAALDDSVYECAIEEKTGGIWVDLKVRDDAEWLLFRADIDGLPIAEETDLPYASLHPGRMHACGHDTHTAMLLAAFRAITQGAIKPTRNIRFVWQRAEENAWDGSGGESLVAEGVCDGMSAVYGLHIASTLEPGVLFSRPGIALANASHLSIEVQCDGGHTMRPQAGANAIDIITDIHVALRGLPLRVLGPEQIVSFLPTMSISGSAPNVMPNRAELFYTLRNFLPREVRDNFIEAVRKKVEAVIAGYTRASLASFTFYPGFPPLINDPSNFHATTDLLKMSGHKTGITELIFAGEDFAFYLEKCPGSFWTLGAKQGEGWDHHTALFNPDEQQLWKGVSFWLSLATAGAELTAEIDHSRCALC